MCQNIATCANVASETHLVKRTSFLVLVPNSSGIPNPRLPCSKCKERSDSFFREQLAGATFCVPMKRRPANMLDQSIALELFPSIPTVLFDMFVWIQQVQPLGISRISQLRTFISSLSDRNTLLEARHTGLYPTMKIIHRPWHSLKTDQMSTGST